MKLSKETLEILKKFANINSGIVIRKGSVLKTTSPNKTILATCVVAESFPSVLAIYDLNNFLSIFSSHKEEPALEFKTDEEKYVYVVGVGGRSRVRYHFASENMTTTPPDKSIVMPTQDFKFKLTTEDLDWVLKMSSVLQSPNISIRSDGKKASIVTLDVKNDSAHVDSLDIGKGNGSKFDFVFKTENWKMLPGNYDVTIASKGIAHFKGEKNDLNYWIALEKDSTFTGK